MAGISLLLSPLIYPLVCRQSHLAGVWRHFIGWPCRKLSAPLSEIVGEIIYIDGFGNLFTNIGEHDLTGMARAQVEITFGAIHIAGLASNYAAAEAGSFLAVVNSWGLLEIAVYQGSAQQNTGARIGDKVQLTIVS